MEDRGGLRYSIVLRNQFSNTSKQFRTEMRKNKAEFSRFRAALNKSRADTTKWSSQLAILHSSITKAQNAINKVNQQAAGAKKSAEEVKRLKLQYERLRQTLARQLRLNRQIRAQQKGITSESRRTERAVRRTNQHRRKAAALQRKITNETKRTQGAANRVAFTFRRLFGILAAFQAARAGVQGFVGLVKSSINFNRQIEDSQISLAALIVATGEVTNEQGKAVKGAEAFAIAMKEARVQSAALRQDSLKTIATYQELLRAYQAGVGPGLEAGLKLDEIREITIRVSQAAAALTLPQNQLIEEIRSLLRGTIQARTTIVASVLGITNEDIRRTKEAGTLYEFLTSRLDAFRLATKETQNTVTGLMARIRDAFGFTAGVAGVDFFASFKQTLRDIFDTLVDIERDGKGVIKKITPDPKAVAILSKLFNGLKNFLESLSVGLKGVDLTPLTEGLFQILSSISGTDVQVAFEAMLALIATISTALTAAFEAIRDIAKMVAPIVALVDIFSPLLAIIVKFRVAWWGILLISRSLVATAMAIGTSFKAATLSASGLGPQLTKAQLAARSLAIGMSLVALAAQPLVQHFLGINASIGDSVMLLSKGFADAIDGAMTKLQILSIRIKDALGEAQPDDDFFDTALQWGRRWWKAFNADITNSMSELSGIFGENFISEDFADASRGWYKSLVDEMSMDHLDKGISEADRRILKLEEARKKRHLELGKLVQDVAERSAGAEKDMAKWGTKMEKILKDIQKYTINGMRHGEEMTDQEKLRLATSFKKVAATRREIDIKRELLALEDQGVKGDQLTLKNYELKLAALQQQKRDEMAVLNLRKSQQKAALEKAKGTAAEKGEKHRLTLLLEEEKNVMDSINADLLELELRAKLIRQTINRTMFAGLAEGLQALYEADKASADLASQRAILAAERAGARGDRLDLAQNRAEHEALQRKLVSETAIYNIRKRQQRVALEQAKGTALEASERLKLQALLLEEENTLGNINLEMDQLNLEAEKLDQIINGTLFEGFYEGLKNFATQFSSAFQTGADLIQGIVNDLASTISQTIVDAFDPTKEVDIVERFAQLMQQIAQVIIQELIKLAIAKALINAMSGGVGGALGFSNGGPIGMAEGGQIPNKPAPAAAIPQGLHHTDKVPIWAAKGEFMQRADAVRKYGLQVMDRINRGLVDPSALKALAGVKSLRRVSRPTDRSAGFAEGGMITRPVATPADTSGGGQTNQGPTPAFLVMDEQTTDRMLHSNRESYFRFYRKHADMLRSILDIGKK